MYCGHSFTWMSVLPPTHCPLCGACLGCGQQAVPYSPPYTPVYPQPYAPPYPVTPWPGRNYITKTTTDTSVYW